MRSLALFFLSATLFQVAACHTTGGPPADLRIETIDPKTIIRDSDTIVLGVPLSQHDVKDIFVNVEGRLPVRLVETETVLKTLLVIKGAELPSTIRFRFFDGRAWMIMGPPQGPSGGIGARGIFFLRRQADGTFRSSVDFYRPDIPTSWLTDASEIRSFSDPAESISDILLTFRKSDDARRFAARLGENVSMVRGFTSFLATFDLLRHLVSANYDNTIVSHGACVQLAEWYPLQLPKSCLPIIAGTQVASDRLESVRRSQQALRAGGVEWIHSLIGTDDPVATLRYLGGLSNAPEEETRIIARDLRRVVK